MAARTRQKTPTVEGEGSSGKSGTNTRIGSRKKQPTKSLTKKELNEQVAAAKIDELKEMHLPPLPLVMAVLVCSGALWVLALRDFLATGRSIFGPMDDAMLHFTKSTEFFDDSNGYFKSTSGGFSSVQAVTTDENNMGGLFVRKICGAAALTVHTQKLMPLLFHPSGAQWALGHFNPMLITAVLGDLAIAIFYQTHLGDLDAAGASELGNTISAIASLEALVMLCYFVSIKSRASEIMVGGDVGAVPEGKCSHSVTSRIVMRTVAIVTGLISTVAARDFFFPGQIVSPIPHDDIYLEWTGAFIHSPPMGSPEADEHSMEAPLFVGDKFVSQLAALHLLISSLQKFTTAFFIRNGKNNSGETQCKMIWKVQALGDALLVFVFRLFVAAAKSASLDLRWHLMCLGYEAFILAMYGFC